MTKHRDGTVARMAGNILAGLVGPYIDQEHGHTLEDEDAMVQFAVRIAQKTLAEIARIETETAIAAEVEAVAAQQQHSRA